MMHDNRYKHLLEWGPDETSFFGTRSLFLYALSLAASMSFPPFPDR